MRWADHEFRHEQGASASGAGGGGARAGRALGRLLPAARGGQLEGPRCNIHWKTAPASWSASLHSNAPAMSSRSTPRYTAPAAHLIDLLLEIVRGDFGPNIANPWPTIPARAHPLRRRPPRVGHERDLTAIGEASQDRRLMADHSTSRSGRAVRQVGGPLRAPGGAAVPAASWRDAGALLHGCGWSARESCCARPTCRSSTWRSPPASPRIPISRRATGCSSAARPRRSGERPIEGLSRTRWRPGPRGRPCGAGRRKARGPCRTRCPKGRPRPAAAAPARQPAPAPPACRPRRQAG